MTVARVSVALVAATLLSCTCDRPRVPCTNDVQCPDTYACVSGRCEPCPVCPDDQRCAAGACVPIAGLDHLAVTSPAQTVVAGACSAAVIVELRDALNNPAVAATSTLLEPSSSASSTRFFADPSCTSQVATVDLPAGATTQSFYFQDAVAGAPVLTVAAAGLGQTSQAQTVSPQPPSRLIFATAPQTIAVGACSQQVSVQAQDPLGNPSPVAQPTTVSLGASTGTLTFYANPTCTTQVTSVVLPAGSSTGGFFFKDTVVETSLVSADSPGLTGAQQLATIEPVQATTLAFVSAPQTVAVGACSAAVSLHTRDAFGSDSNVSAPTRVSLLAPTMKFFTDAACTSQVSEVVVTTGAHAAAFYFSDTTVGTRTITARAAGFSDGSQAQTLTPGAPSRLVFTTSAQSLVASQCSGAVTVQSQDGYGNPTSAQVSVNLAASSTPPEVAAATTLFGDASCTTTTSSLAIPAGSSQASFWFRAVTGGSVTLLASAGGMTGGSQQQTVLSTVRSGSCTIASNGTATNCSVSPALVDTTRTLLFFQSTNAGTSGAEADVRCSLANALTITCDRAGSGTAATIRWQAVEFPPATTSPTVRHFTAACAGSSTTVSFSPSVLSLSDSFVLFSATRSSTTAQTIASTRTARLSGSNQVTISLNSGGGNVCTGDNYALQVVEFPGASVTTGTTSIAAGALASAVTVAPSVDPTRTFLLHSWRSAVASPGCARQVRGAVSATNALVFARGAGDAACASVAIDAIEYQRVELPAGNVVQSVQLAMGAGTATASTPIAAVDLTRTAAISGGEVTSGQGLGESGYTAAGDFWGEALARHTFTNGTTLRLDRDSSLGPATFSPFVIQFLP